MSRQTRSGWVAAVVAGALSGAAVAAVLPFPGDLPGTQIGSGLPSAYEPSGGAWHPRLERLFLVHDGGMLTRMDRNGEDMLHWTIGGDLEGVAVALLSASTLRTQKSQLFFGVGFQTATVMVWVVPSPPLYA